FYVAIQIIGKYLLFINYLFIYQSLIVKFLSTMTLEEATATSPTWKRRVGNDHEQQTCQTNFYELTRTYPPNNLLLQNTGKTQQSYRR
ncbi:hypothetical protein, partial [Prevotella denticola]|uniref:hypothetical protein n=1 Tax=Prevotella denticola TaxID=28129 RepID=UPI0022E6493D